MFIDLIIETEQTAIWRYFVESDGEIVHTKVSISENITIFVAYLRKGATLFYFGDSVFIIALENLVNVILLYLFCCTPIK